MVGASGSGKTTLAMHLESKGISHLVSYTTRPQRDGEINGREHWFVDEDAMPSRDVMLAYAHFGGHHYWTTIHQVTPSVPMTYAIDEKALLEMTEKFGHQIRFIKVYIRRDNLSDIERDRLNRDKDRIVLPDKYYDIIIDNHLDLENFFKTGEQLIKSLL